MVEQVLAAGKHVVCEKPLAMNVAEGERLARGSRKEAGVVHAVNFNIRFYPLCQQARAMVRPARSAALRHPGQRTCRTGCCAPSDWNWRLEPELAARCAPSPTSAPTGWSIFIEFIAGKASTRVCADFATSSPCAARADPALGDVRRQGVGRIDYEERPIRTED